MTTRIALYDMDRTITVRGTYTGFLLFMAWSMAPWRLLLAPLVPLVLLSYVFRLIPRGRAKEINQTLMIGGRVSRARLEPHLQRHADRVMRRNIRQQALAQIAQDRADGYTLVLATASYRLYVEAIADRLGFDAVIATDHLIQDLGYIRAKIAGENCYDEAKLRMIQTWMATRSLDRSNCHIRAYSDHVSDVPMLAFADEGFAANPHPPLEAVARERGWPVLRWS